ncbi:hypothetical protein AK812_SmicGene16250 [Symbiodinium microadriaticum]|uniref:Uncharacterized protein n=1 Tax=Symbiodinium microadriaticum TaxID=2951 RepID=A0A1Q9E0U6_SYMMI|nr:hypothetical protein AK812_SmicGene16250 [Symbiodinium microadriaticum]
MLACRYGMMLASMLSLGASAGLTKAYTSAPASNITLAEGRTLWVAADSMFAYHKGLFPPDIADVLCFAVAAAASSSLSLSNDDWANDTNDTSVTVTTSRTSTTSSATSTATSTLSTSTTSTLTEVEEPVVSEPSWTFESLWLAGSLSDYNGEDWINDQQTVIGLVLLGTTPFAACFLGCCTICLRLIFCGQTAQDMQKTLSKHGVVQATKMMLTLATLWESAALFILFYSTLKHSPAIAVLEAFVYSLYQGDAVHVPAADGLPPREEEITEQQLFMYVCGSVVGLVLRLREQSFLAAEWEPFWHPYFYEDFRRPHHFAKVRCFMSWLANEAFARTIFFLLPVILMYSPDLLEFVKDATCIVFIAHLDDVQSTEEDQWIVKGELVVQEKLGELKKLMADFANMKERDDQKKLIAQQQERIQELQQIVVQQQASVQELKQAAEKGEAQTTELGSRVEKRLRQIEDSSQVEELKRLLHTKMNEVETTKMELKQFVMDKLFEKRAKELEHLEKKKLMD